jgi:pimeloyl-ACP methyl ester carboxylesterase
MPTDYTALLEDIASHGYVVVGINPTYFCSATVFSDGRQVGGLPLGERLWHKPGTSTLEDLFPIWVQDMVFVLNQVTKLDSDPQDPFLGRLDLSRVGAFGHSYGGAAAASACYEDERLKAGIDIDGSPRGKRSTWQRSKPLMLLQSDHGLHKDDSELLYQGAKTGYLLSIKGSKHRAFTDWALYPLPVSQREELLGSVPGPRMMQLSSAYIRAFFDLHLRGLPAPLLQEHSDEYPEVEFRKH